MASLLISKINGIKVIQVGESKLSVENKSEDGGKVGGGRKIGFVGGGMNKTIDLGKGKKKHTLKIYAFNRSENDALFKIFYEERYCTIVDKFKGKIKVYIDSIDVTDSDKHVNRTVYDVSCTVQDTEFAPNINFGVSMASTIRSMEGEIGGMVNQLASVVDTVDTKIDSITGALSFVDSALDMVRTGIGAVLDVKSSILGAYRAVKSKIDTGKRLFESIKGITEFPNELTSLLKGITDDSSTNITNKSNNSLTNNITNKSNNSLTGKISTFQKVQKSEVTPVIEPVVRGKPVSEVDVEQLSQFEVATLEKEVIASQLVNKVKAVKDMKSILVGGFNSQEDFEMTVNATIERLKHVGYSNDEVSDKVHIIKAFANEQEYRDIIEIEVRKATPLVSLVYGRYGSLDNYDSIEAMNGFMDNDAVQGSVRVFA